MRIGINDHIDGTEHVAGADPVAAARAAGQRAWAQTDARLERVRARLDHPRRVLVRDFIIFELKQFLDSFKGLIISQVAIAGFVIDMIRPRGRDFKAFYKVMDIGERMDRWLSLYGASRHAAEDPEGLMGESREGSPTMLGALEHIVHRVVVGEHEPQGELYPRSRSGPPPGAGQATGATSGSAATPASGRPTRTAQPGTDTFTETTTDSSTSTSTSTSTTTADSSTRTSTSTAPQEAGASRDSAPPPPPPSPEPERRSSFQVENYGRGPARGDA